MWGRSVRWLSNLEHQNFFQPKYPKLWKSHLPYLHQNLYVVQLMRHLLTSFRLLSYDLCKINSANWSLNTKRKYLYKLCSNFFFFHFSWIFSYLRSWIHLFFYKFQSKFAVILLKTLIALLGLRSCFKIDWNSVRFDLTWSLQFVHYLASKLN